MFILFVLLIFHVLMFVFRYFKYFSSRFYAVPVTGLLSAPSAN